VAVVQVAVVLGGNCSRWQLSRWQLFWVAIVLGGSCLGGSFPVAVVRVAVVRIPCKRPASSNMGMSQRSWQDALHMRERFFSVKSLA